MQISNLKPPFTTLELRDLVEKFGKFERCWTNRTQSHAMVEFRSLESAKAALEELLLSKWPPESGNRIVLDYIEKSRMNELISAKQ